MGMNNFEMSMRQSERSKGKQYDDNVDSDEENGKGQNDYDVEDDDTEPDEDDDTNSDVRPESDDEEDGQIYQIDEGTLIAIIKVQAHIRGFLTRKMIYEHLEQLVYQNQVLYN